MDPIRAPEPMGRAFASTLSNEAVSLGLVPEEAFRTLLVAHALFFDKIVLGASDLLANRPLYEILKADPDHASHFLHDVVSPVVMANESVGHVAEAMIRRGTIHDLPSPADLVRHASIFDSSSLELLPANEPAVREQYRSLVLQVANNGHLSRILGLGSASPGWLRHFTEWVARHQGDDFLYCTSIFRWADSHVRDPSARHKLKIFANTALHVLTSETQYAAFVTPPSTGAILEAIGPSSDLQFPDSRSESEEATLSLDLALVSQLPLEDVLALRGLPPFSTLRSSLARYRSGHEIPKAIVLQRQLEEAGGIIHDFAASTRLGRAGRLTELGKVHRNARLRFLFDVTSVTLPSAFALVLGHPAAFVFAAATSYGLKRLSTAFAAIPRLGMGAYAATGRHLRFAPIKGAVPSVGA